MADSQLEIEMYKVIKMGMAVLLFSCLPRPLYAEVGSLTSNGVLVYKDMIGGPYFDVWYVDGELSELNDLRIYRDGKSGTFESSIEVDCTRQTIKANGAGELYAHIALTPEEAQRRLSEDVVEHVLKALCAN